MRSAMHWGVPLVTNVSSVTAALSLARHGLPLAAVAVPVSEPQAVLDLYAALRSGIGQDGGVAATPAISLPLCSGDSDALLRFAAYASLTSLFSSHGNPSAAAPVGALWWDGLGDCAPVGSPKFALAAAVNRRITQKAWTAAFGALGSSSSADVRVWSTSTLRVAGSVQPGSIHGGLLDSMDRELLLFEFNPPNSSAGSMPESGTFFVLSTELPTASTSPPREVTVVTRPEITSTTPVEGCAFVGSTACDLRRVGNILPLTLAGGAGQLVTFVAPPAPPPYVPPSPSPSPAPPTPKSSAYGLVLGACTASTSRKRVNNTWGYNASSGALWATWPSPGYSAYGQGYALVIDCGCFPDAPTNPGCGACPGCANRPGPEPLAVGPLDVGHPGACGSNGVWSTSLLPDGPPTELRILPSITRQRPIGKCLTSDTVGGRPVISSSTCGREKLQRWALSSGGLLRLGNASSDLCLTAVLEE